MNKILFCCSLTLFTILAVPIPFLWAQSTPSAALQPLAESNNAFGMDLFHHLTQSVTNDKNLVFSPYSISTALAMAWMGARNNTETQMTQVLHFTGDREGVGNGFHQLRDGLEAEGKDGGFDLSIANSLWLQKDYNLLQPFLDGLTNDFNAPPSLVDFRKDTELARLQINQWVEDKTNDKIKDLIPHGGLDPVKTFMVLVNAVYFKADWLNAFEPEATKQLSFHFSADNSADVSMMQQWKKFKIVENDQAQVLELPYKGNKLSMLVILPRNEQGLPELEKNLNSDTLNTWFSNMSSQTVSVFLPKFKFTFGTVELNPYLTDMGMPEAFDRYNADFSGMAMLKPTERIYIWKVFHKAFVNVDEKGTEAAAATGVVMARSFIAKPEPKIYEFIANHPFLFLIRDNQTKSILFIGRVADPRAEE